MVCSQKARLVALNRAQLIAWLHSLPLAHVLNLVLEASRPADSLFRPRLRMVAIPVHWWRISPKKPRSATPKFAPSKLARIGVVSLAHLVVACGKGWMPMRDKEMTRLLRVPTSNLALAFLAQSGAAACLSLCVFLRRSPSAAVMLCALVLSKTSTHVVRTLRPSALAFAFFLLATRLMLGAVLCQSTAYLVVSSDLVLPLSALTLPPAASSETACRASKIARKKPKVRQV